ncbi:MAG: hypothetical protein Q9221_001446 [Calogaya cf. arnoldii]
MRLALLPSLLALTLHATPRLARPISPGSSARQIPTLGISLPKANVQSSSELSSSDTLSSDVPLDITGFNEHAYPIKGTDLVLAVTLGARLDGPSLAGFLNATHDVVAQGIAQFGGAAGLPMNAFERDQGKDLEFVAKSSQELSHGLTWASTKEVIEGLQGFLIEAEQFQEASCRVNLATGGKDFLGYVDVRRKRETRQAILVRNLPGPLPQNNMNM